MKNKDLLARFGRIMQNKREFMGLSQEDIAEMLGVHQSTYAQYEKGNRNMKLDLVIAVCQILKIDLTEFIQDEDRRISR